MGEVWKAEHALLARPAAVKLIRPEVLDPSDPGKAQSMIGRFKREAQNTANLRSVHTVELYDFGVTDSGTLYFVMELLDGIDLETLVHREGPLPPARVRFLVRQVCDSLQEAHAAGLVHRDVKPANILSCRLGGSFDFVKVLDLGLAKQRASEIGADEVKLTREGTVLGTPAYMPPETVTGGVTDARSDIYALGCVMFWMLTGELVFEGSDAMSMVVRHAQEAPQAPSRRSERPLPRCLDRIVLACLEKDPAARPQSAAEVKGMLDACELEDAWTEADARRWWQQQS
jgi:serine/threonine-protein kinase